MFPKTICNLARCEEKICWKQQVILSCIIIVAHSLGPNSEMSVKLHNDYWVIGKRADQREVYIVLSQRNFGLLEASGESVPFSVNIQIKDVLQSKK